MNTSADSALPVAGSRQGWSRWIAASLWPLALLAYFIVVSVCTAIGRPLPAALLLIALLGVALARAWIAHHRADAVFVILNLALVIAALALAGPLKAIELTLVIVQAAVSAVFLRSLLGARTDLVTRLACAILPERSARDLAYTRAVSWSWAIFMALLALISLAFTFAASTELWWWWKFLGTSVLPVAFFCAEWLLRQWILRGEPKPGIFYTLRMLPKLDYPSLFRL